MPKRLDKRKESKRPAAKTIIKPRVADSNSGDDSSYICLPGSAEQSHGEYIRELGETIRARGWKDSAESLTGEIQFIADLANAGHLALAEIQNYARRTKITVDTLMKLQDDRYEEECCNLTVAVQAFNNAWVSRSDETCLSSRPSREEKLWSLSKALDWRDHLDSTRQFCEDCCHSWPSHLNGISADQRSAALECVREIENRIPLLRSGRLADTLRQYNAIEKCMILNFKLVGYIGDVSNFMEFTQAVVHSQTKWAALMEALNTSRWLDSSAPRGYLTTVATTIYKRDVKPDIPGRDSQGVEHSGGQGVTVSRKDALSSKYLPLEKIEDTKRARNKKGLFQNDVIFGRRFTERSVAELQGAAIENPDLAEYVNAIVRNPTRRRPDVWAELGWDDQHGKRVDRKYRRLLQRLRELGAGMQWREIPMPGSSPSQTVYFEVLEDGARGGGFGVYQYKPVKTDNK